MRMRFKASMPDPRILIIQIVVVAVLASVFRNLLALFLLVLIVDFLLLLQCGWAVFWKNLLSYAAMLLILFALQEIYIPIISDLFPLFLLLMARLYPAYLAVRVLIEKAPMDELLFSLEIWRVPKLVLIPLAVIYRYIPTILKEIGYIRESLKMRNLHSSMWDKVCHPMQNAENFFVPLLYRSEKFRKNCLPLQSAKGLAQKENERAARK